MHSKNGFTGSSRLDIIIVELSEAYGFTWLKDRIKLAKEKLIDIRNYIVEHHINGVSEKIVIALESDKECSVTLRRNGVCVKKSVFIGYI